MIVGTLLEWEPTSGKAVSWCPTPKSLEKAAEAPLSDVPVSYMQDQHIRGYCEQKAKGLDYSRLMVISCDAPGQCDIRAMDFIVNAHLRRHDTYRSSFEYTGDGKIIRRAMKNPNDIRFVPVEHGELTLDQARDLVVSTPDALQWDCFRFGIIQGAEHFTFYASIDHVHVDAMVLGVVLMEFHMMYAALVGGNQPLQLPPPGSYDKFCVDQMERTSALTLESPQVRAWTEFAEANDGSYPDFPLPLGDPLIPWGADIVTETMLDEGETARFEAACIGAGARFIGGVMACAGFAEHELTGAPTYYGLTPSDTRKTPEDALTQGWFTGLVPVTVPIAGYDFGDAAKVAQESFDTNRQLAETPYGRVMELAPWLQKPRPNFPVLNFLDAGTAPLSALLTAQLDDLNIGVFSDGRYSYQLCIYVMRVQEQTAVTVMYPDNPIARESVAKYVEALKSVYRRVVDTGQWQKVA
jgi:hypothetical protein